MEASARNCNAIPSRKVKDLPSEKLTSERPGPTTVFLREDVIDLKRQFAVVVVQLAVFAATRGTVSDPLCEFFAHDIRSVARVS